MPALEDPIFRRSVVYICETQPRTALWGLLLISLLENLQIEGILEKLKVRRNRAFGFVLIKP